MNTITANSPDPAATLTKAVLSARKALGLTMEDLGEIVGKDRSTLSRGSLDPSSKPGELALLLIRVYRSLYALMGGQEANLQHWMHTENHHVGGVPAERIKTIQGLASVVDYLDAIRGKA